MLAVHILRHTSASSIVSFMLCLWDAMAILAKLNTLLHSTDISGMEKKSRAIREMIGYSSRWFRHHSIGLWNASRLGIQRFIAIAFIDNGCLCIQGRWFKKVVELLNFRRKGRHSGGLPSASRVFQALGSAGCGVPSVVLRPIRASSAAHRRSNFPSTMPH